MAWWQVALKVAAYLNSAYNFNEAYEKDDIKGMAASAASAFGIKTPSSVEEGLKQFVGQNYPVGTEQISQMSKASSVGGALKSAAKVEFPSASKAVEMYKGIREESGGTTTVTTTQEKAMRKRRRTSDDPDLDDWMDENFESFTP
jgi:hypothetical protein